MGQKEINCLEVKMKLEDIGFYTLSDERAINAHLTSQMWRCELIITDRCNFSCPYCRGLRKDCCGVMHIQKAFDIIRMWAMDKLKNIRFSGGEPTLHLQLPEIIKFAKQKGIERIAISTNGSQSTDYYKHLIDIGVDDFSISLDGCCAAGVDKMSGTTGKYNRVITNVRELSKLTYVTVGIVITNNNVKDLVQIVEFAHGLGVADIRIISAAQYNQLLIIAKQIPKEILHRHPILSYRVNNLLKQRNVRGLRETDSHQCYLTMDDSCIAGKWHFPCIIYMREQGEPIGEVGLQMRQERGEWFWNHDTHKDPICNKNCLDVCIDYNNKAEKG